MAFKKTYRAFSAGELSPEMYGRYDVDKYGTGCMILKNWIIMAQGGVYKRPGKRFIAEAGDSSKKVRMIPFIFGTTQAYMLEFGHEYMRVHKNGAQVLEAEKTVESASEDNPAVLEITGHGFTTGDEVYLYQFTGGEWPQMINGRGIKITVLDTDNFELDGIDSTDFGTFTAGKVARVYEIATPYGEDDLFKLYYAQTADVMTICHEDFAPRDLTRTGHTSWTLDTITFAPSVAAPTGQSAAATTGSGSVTYNYKITAVIEANYEESLPSAVASVNNNLATSGNKNTVSWSAVSGAIKYNIYKEKSGVYGYIGSSETTSFVDQNIDPDVTDTPPRAGNPFGADGSNDCPRIVAFHQQRRVFASTKNKPDTIWMSRAGAYKNMTTSLPNKADDAITFAIASGQVNAIKHMLPFRTLLTMTTAQEWNIGSEGVLSPTTVDAKPETNYGSSDTKPIMIGNTAIFAARFGKRVRDYAYTFESDGFDGNDLSVLSRHLLKNRQIVDWAFAQEPDDVIWAVMSDGIACTLTYMREHRVWGWARHETLGTVESVGVIPDEVNRRDVVYFVVKRTINGTEKRYIEFLEEYKDDPDTESFFLDSGLSYSGPETNTVSGLWHLEGESVTIYADGNVLAPKIVENGQITISREYSTIHVGLSYDFELQPMPTEGDQGAWGSTKGDPKQMKGVYIEVYKARGLRVAQTQDGELNEIPPVFQDGDMSKPIMTQTTILEVAVRPYWNGAYVAPFIYDNYPVPGKILTMTPIYET